MSQQIKCIFCLEKAEASEEHVIPDSIGGRLVIKEVCKTCNSKLGKSVDGPFSSIWFVRLARFAARIGGKRNEIPFPFDGLGKNPDGTKVLLSKDLKPYTVSDVSVVPKEDGVDVRIVVDASDMTRLTEVLTNRLRKALHEIYPAWSDGNLNAVVAKVIERVPQAELASSHDPIAQQKVINLLDFKFEALKVAYEAWFRQFGYEWVEQSSTAAMMRTAILNRDDTQKIGVGLGGIDIPDLFPPNGHAIILLNYVCIVSLFGVTCMIGCEGADSRFMLKEGDARIVYQEDADGPVKEILLAEYIGRKFPA